MLSVFPADFFYVHSTFEKNEYLGPYGADYFILGMNEALHRTINIHIYCPTYLSMTTPYKKYCQGHL